eukprot:TRINITY_DN12662_c0_g1_i1.p1 TRINITY_DN12662_c0_g1~~TRINITY_DN12662_c0_g1_i1.p1  ORF type:complete len:1679 (-),score=401.09 TRINITY_DN12662_c0_g1_i1:487-5523(-)
MELQKPCVQETFSSISECHIPREAHLSSEHNSENHASTNKTSESQEGGLQQVSHSGDPQHSTDENVYKGKPSDDQFESKSLLEENSVDSDLIEDDVKVCDICGDAGIEDKLAVCSSCNDGAEHIYCMQTMLDKVPEGDWLCEECKIAQKGSWNKTMQQTEASSKPVLENTKTHNSDNNLSCKVPSKMDRKKLLTRLAKGISSPQTLSKPSLKRQAETSEFAYATRKQMPEIRVTRSEATEVVPTPKRPTSDVKGSHSDTPDISVTRKQPLEVRASHKNVINTNLKPGLSRESSFKGADIAKTKSFVSSSLTGTQPSSHNNNKMPVASGIQSKCLSGNFLVAKNKSNSLLNSTSDSFPLVRSNSSVSSTAAPTAANDKQTSISKSPEATLLHSSSLRFGSHVKATAVAKVTKETAAIQPTDKKEGTGSGVTDHKIISKSSSFKSFGSLSSSSLMESKAVPNVQNESLRESGVSKTRKDVDLRKKKSEVKAGVSDAISMGCTVLPLSSNISNQDSSSSQSTVREASPKRETCPSESITDAELTVATSGGASTLIEESAPASLTGTSSNLFTTDSLTTTVDSATSSANPSPNGSRYMSPYHEPATTSIIKSLISCSAVLGDGKNSNGLEIKGEVAAFENHSNNDKSNDWASRTPLPPSGPAALNNNKELDPTEHAGDVNVPNLSAQSNHDLSVEAPKNSNEASGLMAGQLNTSSDNVTSVNKDPLESEHSSEQKLLKTEGEEGDGKTQVGLTNQTPPEREEFKNSSVPEISASNCDIPKDNLSSRLDTRSVLAKEFLTSSSTTTFSGETALATSFGRSVRQSYNVQTNSTHRTISVGASASTGEASNSINSCNPSCTVHLTESTVTAVKREISNDIPLIFNGNVYGTHNKAVPNRQFAQLEVSKKAAFPDPIFLWQGSFEVRSKGNMTTTFVGLQAHASTCAARKVLDAAKKFPSCIPLEEVPRLNAWPKQFQCIRPSDENIALYFFAKDLESFERSYRKILDHMVNNDYALRGNCDGVDLLIFPSNQLPAQSQRWNRLLYLWGVFRERKSNCIETLPYQEKGLGQLLANNIGGHNSTLRPISSISASLSVVGFSETSNNVDDVRGIQCGMLKDMSFTKLEKEQSMPGFPLPSDSSKRGKEAKNSNSQNLSMSYMQNLPVPGRNENSLFANNFLFKQYPKSSSESTLLSSSMLRSNDQGLTVDPAIITTGIYRTKRDSVTTQKDSEAPNLGDARVVEFLACSQSTDSQMLSRVERTKSESRRQQFSVSHYSSSLERQDNSSDSSKAASTHSLGSQTDTVNEKIKSRNIENEQWKEKIKEVDSTYFKNKDSHSKELKSQESNTEQDKDRNGDISGERERAKKIALMKREEHSGYDPRYNQECRYEKHPRYFSHFPSHHLIRATSLRSNSYDQQHSQPCSPSFDEMRQSQALSTSELYGDLSRNGWPLRKRTSNGFTDEKGHKRLKKSYSEIYVRESSGEQDSSMRYLTSRSSTDLNIGSYYHDTGSAAQLNLYSEQSQNERHAYNQKCDRDPKTIESSFYPDKADMLKNYCIGTASNQEAINRLSQDNSPGVLTSLNLNPTAEQDTPELLERDVPNLELALGAKSTCHKQINSSFIATDKNMQQFPDNPPASEEGSTLSLSLSIQLSEREHSGKSLQAQNEVLPEDVNIDTSLILFGGRLKG